MALEGEGEPLVLDSERVLEVRACLRKARVRREGATRSCLKTAAVRLSAIADFGSSSTSLSPRSCSSLKKYCVIQPGEVSIYLVFSHFLHSSVGSLAPRYIAPYFIFFCQSKCKRCSFLSPA